ncbi:hypothetical protein HQ585_08330 [candidate division KSB1 bacterium]|nr:hypothetical protein [candidate division KSB1 bacterium]
MKKLLITILLTLTVVQASWLTELNQKDGIDFATLIHYISAGWYTRARTSGILNNVVGMPVPTNKQVFWVELVPAVFIFEGVQYMIAGGWPQWCAVYGGKEEAQLNMWYDIGAGLLGGLLPLRSKSDVAVLDNWQVTYLPSVKQFQFEWLF